MKKFTFKYDGKEVLNINDVIRQAIRNLYEGATPLYSDSEVASEFVAYFRDILLEMYEEDISSFDWYTKSMLANTYMMLVQTMSQNTMNIYHLITYELFEENITSEDLYNYIANDSTILDDMIKYTVEFDRLSILGKKMVVQNNKSYYAKLVQISPFCQLDIMQYGSETKVNDFLEYYTESLELFVLTPDMPVRDIEYHMRHLYLSDRKNYINNLQEMGNVFYKWTKFLRDTNEILDDCLCQYLEIFEHDTIEKIGDFAISDAAFLFTIIDKFCYYSASNGIKIENQYITKEIIDICTELQLPDSLKVDYKQKKKK